MLNEDHGFAGGYTQSNTIGGVHSWSGGNLLRSAYLSASTFSADQLVSATPNPTSGIFNINGKNISQIVVYDVLGKEIISKKYSFSNEINCDISSLNNGLYLVKVYSAETTSVIKVIKN